VNDLLPRSARVVWYNRKLFVIVVAIAFMVGLGHSVFRLAIAPRYRAKATVTMLPSYSEILYTMQRSDFAGQNPALVLTQTQTEFLMSRPIAAQVVAKLWGQNEGGSPAGRLGEPGASSWFMQPLISLVHLINFAALPPSRLPLDVLTDEMQRSIKVRNVPGSFILGIEVAWRDPAVAQRAANMLADIYVEETRAFNQKSLAVTRDMFQDRIDEQSDSLRTVEAEIRDYKSKSQVYVSLDSETPLQIRQMEEYLQERNRLELRALELRAQINSSRRVRPFTDTVAMSAEYGATREALQNVEQLISGQQHELNKVPQLEYGLLALQQRKEQVKLRMEALQNSLVQAGIAEASYLQTVRVIEPALLPTTPDGPGMLQRLGTWLVFGLLTAASLVLFKEPHGRRIRHPSDLEGIHGLHAAGLIPAPASKAVNGRLNTLLQRGGAVPAVIQKHATQVAGRVFVNGTSGVLLESLRGVGAHAEEVLAFLRSAPRPCVVVNLDEGFHAALLRDKRYQRRVSGADEGPRTLDDDITYYDLHARASASGVSRLVDQIKSLRNGARAMVILSPGVRVLPGTVELGRAAGTVVLAVEANRDDDRDIREYMQMSSPPSIPVKATVLGVDYPSDFMFVN